MEGERHQRMRLRDRAAFFVDGLRDGVELSIPLAAIFFTHILSEITQVRNRQLLQQKEILPEHPQTEESYIPPPTYNSHKWSRLDVEMKLPPNFDSNRSRFGNLVIEDKPQSPPPQEKPVSRIPENNRVNLLRFD
jgi:hypothetical protein